MATKIGNVNTGGPTGPTGPIGATGATGPAGESGATGMIGITAQAGHFYAWDATTAYVVDELTYYSGVFYQALTANTNLQPDVSTSDWTRLGTLVP